MPDYKENIKKVRQEMPDQSETPIEPAGFFGRMFGNPNARATASPWTGNISYNPGAMSSLSPEEINNVFTHELTHSRQIQQTPYINRFANVMRSMIPGAEPTYYERPREQEAYQAERDRTSRLGLNLPDPVSGASDIELPPMSPRRRVLSMFKGTARTAD